MTNWNTLFLNHFHTKESTGHVKELTDCPDWKAVNHLGSPVRILEKLQEGQNAVITLTEHYKTNGKDFFQKMGEKAENLGGGYKLNDHSLVIEQGGSKVAVINGVEASYRRRDSHVVIAGLPIQDNKTYYNLDEEKLGEVLENAAYAHPAHPFLEEFGMSMKELEKVCRTIQDSSAKLFIPYTCAYPVNIDKNARGVSGSETDVHGLANKYNSCLIVEHDHHVHLPSNLGGIGLLKSSSIKHLENGEIPLEEIKKMRIIEPSKTDTFRDLFRAGRTFADQLPNYKEWKSLWKRLTFPYGEDELKYWRDKYYSSELEDLNMDELRNKSRALNQNFNCLR
jgi:hypothetical protein